MTYQYHYENREANFGPPLDLEVEGGAHLTFDVILTDRRSVYALRRPDGFHDGPRGALYFPHGLIRFGETLDQTVQRLAADQAGVNIQQAVIYNLASWVENNHWHMCLNVFGVSGGDILGGNNVSEVVALSRGESAEELAWWTQDQFDAMIEALH